MAPMRRRANSSAATYMIEAPDLDQAVTWAAKCPAAEHGTTEVRPVWPTRGE